MKIAFLGYDFFVDVLENLLSQGHEIAYMVIPKTDNVYDHNRKCFELAERLQCPIIFGKVNRSHIASFRDAGCGILLSMAYPYKIPISSDIKGLNLHPTLLPNGRGRWPLPWILLRYPEFSGLTLHILTDRWDEGPILAQKPIAISGLEDLETLSAKMQLAAPSFVSDAISRLEELLPVAIPQGAGTTWPMPTDADRELPWASGLSAVLKTVRAFGKFESTAVIAGCEWMVTDANGWLAKHTYPPGTLVQRMGREVVMATSDGFVVLRNFHREIALDGV